MIYLSDWAGFYRLLSFKVNLAMNGQLIEMEIGVVYLSGNLCSSAVPDEVKGGKFTLWQSCEWALRVLF